MLKISVVLYVDDCFKPRVNVVIICLALLCFDKDLKVFLFYVMSFCETFPLLFGMHTEYGDKKAITSSIRSSDVCFPLSVVHESLISFLGMPWMREKYESSLFVACMEIWLRKISFSLIPHSVSLKYIDKANISSSYCEICSWIPSFMASWDTYLSLFVALVLQHVFEKIFASIFPPFFNNLVSILLAIIHV